MIQPSAINYKFPKEKKSVVRSSNLESLSDEDNPFCYTWSLMNTGISKIVKDAVKSILTTAGMEITGKLKFYLSPKCACFVCCQNYLFAHRCFIWS